jgi:GalNAc-alpha-(1->4)-GalNAc-alpha-(1->3)-diNAcBac-PP-undecaprenol alpha-1,4-N-acetyl-D-galactosaminyltransferase
MRENKKIALVIPSIEAGGAERVAITLSQLFLDKNEVVLIVLNKTKTDYFIDPNVHVHFLKESYVPSSNWYIAIKNNCTFIQKIIQISRLHQIDILFSFTTTANILVLLSSFFLKTTTIISERNNPEVYELTTLRKILIRILYPFANEFVVQTAFSKSYYQKKINHKNIQIIQNPIDENLILKRKEYTGRENIILNVGRLDENKNQKLLLEAFANINNKNWKLIFVGDGNLKIEYQNLARKLGIASKVDFIGTVNNIETFYNQAKIFVFTSQSEGFPNALLEALSFGVPSISSDCKSGPSEMIQHKENGFLFETNNQKQLEKYIRILMDDESLRQKFSSRSILSSAKYHSNDIFKQWELLLL